MNDWSRHHLVTQLPKNGLSYCREVSKWCWGFHVVRAKFSRKNRHYKRSWYPRLLEISLHPGLASSIIRVFVSDDSQSPTEMKLPRTTASWSKSEWVNRVHSHQSYRIASQNCVSFFAAFPHGFEIGEVILQELFLRQSFPSFIEKSSSRLSEMQPPGLILVMKRKVGRPFPNTYPEPLLITGSIGRSAFTISTLAYLPSPKDKLISWSQPSCLGQNQK